MDETPPSPPPQPAAEDLALEALLFAEPLLPLPPSLEARLADAWRAPRGGRWAHRGWRVARFAAAVLLALGAWLAAYGAWPTPALASSDLEVPAIPLASEAEGGAAAGLAALGVVALAGGLALARRWNRRPAPGAKEESR